MKRLFFFILCIIPVKLSAQENPSNRSLLTGGINIEFYGGYSYLYGYFSSQLNDGYKTGFNLFGPFPSVKKYLVLNGGFCMNRWALINSSNSSLSTYSVRAGGILYYPFTRYFKPYAGVSFSGSVVHLETENLGMNESSYKPGVVFKTGFYGPSYSFFGTKIGVEQEYMEVSNEILKPVNITISLFMNFNAFAGSERKSGIEKQFSRKMKINDLFQSGIKELESGNSAEAKKYFLDVLEIDSDHAGAAGYLKRIKDYESAYITADKLASNGQYFKAIPILNELRPFMKKAGIMLVQIRKKLSGSIPRLEKTGIEAYEKRDYQLCISQMKKILLIDPENRIADIYLPRSIKRKNALERLK